MWCFREEILEVSYMVRIGKYLPLLPQGSSKLNGMYAPGGILVKFYLANLSGMNFSGLGNISGFQCNPAIHSATLDFFGRRISSSPIKMY
ncbi:unnamed protein product [Orchesella dallaii]|uniref:Uncharacterized protein n=1 Tax=Orchesella dallaii TaxID=48710 RepID=A0ABP1QGW4_9HEXA